MNEFERAKQTFQGYSVTMTSWFDTDKNVWRASAPAYLHIIHDSPAACLQGNSRAEAVKNLSSLLSRYFENSAANK